MAGSVNKVILIGNLGQDPEVKSFQNGGRIANLRIATSENWKDKQTGERKERTEWHTVVLQSDGLVGVAERYLRKGSKVYIEGSLRTRKWQDASGNDRYSTEVSVGGPGAVMTRLDGAPAAASATATSTLAAARRTVKHRQRAVEAAQDDLGRIAVVALLVLPFARLQLAFDVDLGALAQVALGDAHQPFGEDRHRVPLGAFLPLARVLVLPLLGRGDPKVADLAAILEALDFGVLPQVADKHDFVEAAGHYDPLAVARGRRRPPANM